MSTIYTDSILVENTGYKIQDIPKLGKDAKRFVGLKFLFNYVIGSSAHGRITGTMQSVPVRCLIDVKGYEAKPVRAVNAHGFAVTSQNTLGIPVGQAYLNPTSVSNTHAVFDINGKEVKIPLDILVSLVRIQEKKDTQTKRETTKVSKATGVSKEAVDVIDQSEARKDIEEIPAFITKLLPNLNVNDVRDRIKQKPGVFSDYNGNIHETIEQVDKANTLIRYSFIQEELTNKVKEESNSQFETIKNK